MEEIEHYIKRVGQILTTSEKMASIPTISIVKKIQDDKAWLLNIVMWKTECAVETTWYYIDQFEEDYGDEISVPSPKWIHLSIKNIFENKLKVRDIQFKS
jgi:hypothetical protein